MAAVLGDFVADHSRFHNMVAAPGLPHDYYSRESSYSSEPRTRPRAASSQTARSPAASSTPQHRAPAPSATPTKRSWEATEADTNSQYASGGSRFPTPPDSSSSDPSSARIRVQNVKSPSSEEMSTRTQTQTRPAATAVGSTVSRPAQRQQPSPPSESSLPPMSQNPAYDASAPHEGRTVRVRDLAHIQSLARSDSMNGGNGPGILDDPPLQAMRYEISGMPIGDVIEMVAALLTKITRTNDLQHDALHRNAAHQQTAANHNNDGTSMSPLSSSVLAFHGKNVPAITILSYLSRIHKYCPTTYEVFLSLLVYFDRMTERVNNMVVQAGEARRQAGGQREQQSSTVSSAKEPAGGAGDAEMQDESARDGDETDSDLADSDEEKKAADGQNGASIPSPSPSATYFVVDSFNIHRLIIAGVTCASKFFSDVFYTNSRYAKVGGLPLAELNHLELQFLVLNDFRLSVPVEDLEAYATMLVEFYAREVVAQRTNVANGTE
ncbi:cyclin-domain-containing protein [Xylariomycetidae sp. FL2044]|nr:cyclin-domain-containing protein [Xylariomycetidae sp. FL2044]